LLTDRDEISNLYRGPSIDATWSPQAILVSDWLISKKYSPLKPLYQMNPNLVGSIYGRSSIRFFRNQPIRNKNGLWWPCLLMDRDEMNSLYIGPSIDASYQISDQRNCNQWENTYESEEKVLFKQ
jgi:hypothetical protein